mmetsp:Transcript_61842/g.90656  ORF Transcript_61842/g.90656 Transcript_61842/m.90656 type:complete len:82 (+) Transcript_61842:124-369(+)
MDNDFFGEGFHLCNGVDDTGCNGPDGHDWNVGKYAQGQQPTIQHHSTIECKRLSASGEYPADCAYKSYDPRASHDYAGRDR